MSTKQYEILGDRLRLAREESNLTQLQAARLLSRPQWFVSRSETGKRRVDIIELAGFARIYRKQLTFFLKDVVDVQ